MCVTNLYPALVSLLSHHFSVSLTTVAMIQSRPTSTEGEGLPVLYGGCSPLAHWRTLSIRATRICRGWVDSFPVIHLAFIQRVESS